MGAEISVEIKARCPRCGVPWVFSDEDLLALSGDLLVSVEAQAFLCSDCSTEFVRQMGSPNCEH
jgi:transposase-like protein